MPCHCHIDTLPIQAFFTASLPTKHLTRSSSKREYQENSPRGKLLRRWKHACEADDEEQKANLKRHWAHTSEDSIQYRKSAIRAHWKQGRTFWWLSKAPLRVCQDLLEARSETWMAEMAYINTSRPTGKVTIARYHKALGWFEEDCARDCERCRELKACCTHIPIEVSKA